MLSEKPWENLSHKGINTLFGSSQLSHCVDPTTQRTEFPRNYYWQDFQRQVEHLSPAEVDAIFPEPKSPQPVGGTAEIKGDIRGAYLLNSSITPLSDVDIVLSDRETGNYYWQDFQRQVEHLSPAEVDAIFPEPKSPQPVGGTAEIKGDIRGAYLLNSSITPLSDVSVVLAHAETGNYYWQNFQGQMVNLGQAEASVIFLKPESPQLVDETAEIKKDIRTSYLFNSSVNQLSDVILAHAETGTAITDFTRLRKEQIGRQKLEISEQFDTLAQREDNWDGRGSQKPTDLTLSHAKGVIGALLDSVISGG